MVFQPGETAVAKFAQVPKLQIATWVRSIKPQLDASYYSHDYVDTPAVPTLVLPVD